MILSVVNLSRIDAGVYNSVVSSRCLRVRSDVSLGSETSTSDVHDLSLPEAEAARHMTPPLRALASSLHHHESPLSLARLYPLSLRSDSSLPHSIQPARQTIPVVAIASLPLLHPPAISK